MPVCMANMYHETEVDESIVSSGKHGLSDVAIVSIVQALKYTETLITRAVVSPSYFNILETCSCRLRITLKLIVISGKNSDLQRYRGRRIAIKLIANCRYTTPKHTTDALIVNNSLHFNKYYSGSTELHRHWLRSVTPTPNTTVSIAIDGKTDSRPYRIGIKKFRYRLSTSKKIEKIKDRRTYIRMFNPVKYDDSQLIYGYHSGLAVKSKYSTPPRSPGSLQFWHLYFQKTSTVFNLIIFFISECEFDHLVRQIIQRISMS